MSLPTSIPSNGADRRSTTAPYAFPPTGNAPVDRALNSARAKVGPYVPSLWRGTPAVESARGMTPLSGTPLSGTPLSGTPLSGAAVIAPKMPPSYPTPAYFTPLGSPAQDALVAPAFDLPAVVGETEGPAEGWSTPPVVSLEPVAPALPWIEAFLSSTPAMPMRAIDEPLDEAVDEPAAWFRPPAPAAIIEEAAAAAEWPMTAAAREAPTPSDAWALDEAAEKMRALADELRDHEGIASEAGEAAHWFDATAFPESLPTWSDDDMIDILPMHKERASAPNRVPTPAATSAIEPWADRARRPGDEHAEAAARALELLARRVREGEISLAGYEPRLGDAAALAAALAALLGVRR